GARRAPRRAEAGHRAQWWRSDREAAPRPRRARTGEGAPLRAGGILSAGSRGGRPPPGRGRGRLRREPAPRGGRDEEGGGGGRGAAEGPGVRERGAPGAPDEANGG